MFSVFDRAAGIRSWRHDRCGRSGGLLQRRRIELVQVTALATSAVSGGVSWTLVSPIAQVATLPLAMVRTTAAAAVA